MSISRQHPTTFKDINMTQQIHIGFSTCPNDTFIFHAMLHGLVDTGNLNFVPHMHDVKELNRMAFKQTLQVTKLSFYAWHKLKTSWEVLDSGAALGFGCGPLLVGRPGESLTAQSKIAVPGRDTTAWLLLQLWNPDIKNIEITRFDNILEGVQNHRYDFGLIIHEGRFVYADYGCVQIVDLGAWWEAKTGLPIPLGCIAIRKDPKTYALKSEVTSILKKSVQYAMAHRNASRTFVKQHAQEMEDQVIDDHIDLYVNDFTISLGDQGKKAINRLEEMADWNSIK